MAETLAELRALSNTELERRIDAQAAHAEPSLNHYLRERDRRDQEKQTNIIYRLTWVATFIAVASFVAACAQVYLAWIALPR